MVQADLTADLIHPFEQSGAPGGRGGDATATAGTISSGSAEADAISVGGSGGNGNGFDFGGARGGDGGSASSFATGSSGTGNATASATATGGGGGTSDTLVGLGGGADASSTARTSGSGNASSSANATGGGPIESSDFVDGSNATAMADASATGGGKAIATAVAGAGFPSNFFGGFPFPPSTAAANATSSAETTNGARAEALSTAGGVIGETQSTAKTSLGGVSVQSTVMAPSSSPFLFGPTTTEAIAQGGSGPTIVDGQAFAISTVLTDKAYATTLIDGASNVADALLGPQDEIFGTANQFGNVGSATSTFDFRFQGDLLLGVIDSLDFSIVVNGAQIFTGSSVNDDVINLGFLGPNIDLTIEGEGVFAFGGAVPEPSTWAMMLLGFAGLGYACYRRTREPRAA